MLAFFRRSLTSLPVLVLFGLLLVVFALTGIQDPFGSSAPVGSIAQLGKRTVTEPEFSVAFDRATARLRQENPALTQAQMVKEGLVEAVAENLINSTAMEELAKKAGLTASNRAVGAEVASIAAFQKGGVFDQDTYLAVLNQNRLTDVQFRTGLAGDLLRQQLLQPVTAALSVPEGEAAIYARTLIDVHKGSIALVPLAKSTPPTPVEVAAWYNANKALVTLPERRAFRYAMIDAAMVKGKSQVTDAQIAAAFAKDGAKYGALATRRLEQVVVPDEAKAKAIAAAAAKQGFAAAAQQLAGFGAADIALGELSEAALAKATSPALAKAVFALAPGGISAPIKTGLGWHVVRYVAPGSAGKTLAQARPAILADLQLAAEKAAIGAIVNAIEDGVEAGTSFPDIAKQEGFGLTVQAAVAANGQAPGQPALAGDTLAIAGKAFRHDPSEGPVVEDLGNGRLVAVETTEIIPAAPQPLTAVQAFATAGAAQAKALKAARAKADAVVAAVKKGTAFAAAVAAQGLQPPQPIAARRVDTLGRQVPPVVTAFLATPAGAVRVVPADQGWVLTFVEAITPGDLAAAGPLLAGTRRELAASLPQEMTEGFAKAARRDLGVVRNDKTIADIRRRMQGDAP